MFNKLKTYGATALSFLEKQVAERKRGNLIAKFELYDEFRSVTPAAALYPALPANFRQLPEEEFEMLRHSIPLGMLNNRRLSDEIALKARGQELTGTYEIKYEHSGMPSFHYYSSNADMSVAERMLAAYAGVARMYGFLDPIAEKQLLWVAINRTVSEIVGTFALRRLSNGTAYAYEDTREISAIFDFGNTVKKNVPHAWRVLVAMIERPEATGPKNIGKRLVAEVNAAGWGNGP